jgi:oligoendopeptidase F
MKSGLSKVFLILIYVLIGAVLGYALAMTKCQNKGLDQVWPEIRQEFNDYLDKMSKQTQEFDEKIKQLTEQQSKKD